MFLQGDRIIVIKIFPAPVSLRMTDAALHLPVQLREWAVRAERYSKNLFVRIPLALGVSLMQSNNTEAEVDKWRMVMMGTKFSNISARFR